ncbi:MAG: helix-turn-helix domain-containing protein [Cypionkella sp.]
MVSIPWMDTLRANIRRLMGDRSEKAVADAAGIDQSWLNRVMCPTRPDGIKSPREKTLRPLAAYLGVSTQELMFGNTAPASLPSQVLRLDPDIIADAMGLLDELDAIAGIPRTARPNPARLAIAYEVIAAGPVESGPSVVVQLADRLRKQGATRGNDEGTTPDAGATDGSSHGSAAKAAPSAPRGRNGRRA